MRKGAIIINTIIIKGTLQLFVMHIEEIEQLFESAGLTAFTMQHNTSNGSDIFASLPKGDC